MADPLSVAASVAGLLSLTIQLLNVAQQYTHDVGNAEEEVVAFIRELTGLSEVLKRLDAFLKTKDSIAASGTPALLAIRYSCEDQLKKLLKKLSEAVKLFTRNSSTRSKAARIINRLKWPFGKQDHLETIESLHRYMLIFDFALSIDGSELLSKTSAEVREIVKSQDTLLSEIRKIFDREKEFIPPVNESLGITKKILTILESPPSLDSELKPLCERLMKLEVVASQHTKWETRQSAYFNGKIRQRLINGISTVSFETKHREIFSKHYPGTGQWLLTHKEFEAWKSGSGPSVLCCLGIPGTGKTVLASMVIEHLRHEMKGKNMEIAYIYCDHRNHRKETPLSLLSTIIRQMLSSSSLLFPAVRKACIDLSRKYAEVNGLIKEHISLLKTLSKAFTRTYLIIDAVDEVPEFGIQGLETRQGFLEALSSLADHSRLFITSRPHTNIASAFPGISLSTIQVQAAEADIVSYVSSRITTSTRLKAFVSKDEVLQSEIVQTVQKKANGMFLLAQFQVDKIRTAISIRQVRKILNSLPEKLQDVYSDCIGRIEKQTEADRLLGMRVLSWITRAKRPLSEQELTHALAFESGDTKIDWTGIPDISTVIGACVGLVHVQTEAVSKGLHEPQVEYIRYVTFAHYTIEVYIRQIDFSGCLDGDLDMVNTCLGYLALDEFKDTSFVESEYPFYSYAATHWLAHAAVVKERVDKGAVLRVTSRPHWILDALVDRKFHDDPIPEVPRSWAVTAAAIHGATYILETLLDSGFQANESFLGFTPLLVAVCYNHPDCISSLLLAGANPNMTALGSWRRFGKGKTTITDYERNWDSRSVLGTAASAGHSEIVTILVQAGAKLDGPPPPLVSAIRENEIAIVDQLLRAGCDPNVRSAYGSSALTEARAMKSAEMVRLLLDAGADPNMTTGFEAPLQSAAICGQWDIVRDFLLRTANPNLRGRPTMTALQIAAYEGKRDIVQLILKAHGDVNLTFGTDSWMQSSKPPLHLALEGRHFDIAQTLIDAGANVNLLAGNPQYTALEFAVTLNHLGLIKRLLKAGANPNIGLESCPLLAAASRFVRAENKGPPKSTAVIRALLGAGADLGACEGRFRESLRAKAIDNVRYKWWRKEDPVVARLCECENMLERKQVGDGYVVVDFVEDTQAGDGYVIVDFVGDTQVPAHAASAECDSHPN